MFAQKKRFEFRLLEIKKSGKILVHPKKTHEEHEINRYFGKIIHQHTRVCFSEKINKKTHKQTQNTKPDQTWTRLGVFFFLQKAPFQQKKSWESLKQTNQPTNKQTNTPPTYC